MSTQRAQVRIAELGFKAAIGTFLGIAIALAIGRTYIRIILTHRITIDDGFFFLALTTLIAGTTTLYIDIPYLFIQQNVNPSTTVITPAFIQLLLRSLKIQSATDVLLSVTLFSVKFSFLFFFHGLLRRVRWLTVWWWCVLGMMVPLSVVFVCCIFIVCPYYDERVLIITIPVALLWRVRISLHRKLVLGGILSLSIFTMIVSIVRIAGADLPNGMIDSAWVNFWLQIEAAVAVII
ncbi:MAG: hypothetical protein Q9218_004087, partial [Villophora microphyllina]